MPKRDRKHTPPAISNVSRRKRRKSSPSSTSKVKSQQKSSMNIFYSQYSQLCICSIYDVMCGKYDKQNLNKPKNIYKLLKQEMIQHYQQNTKRIYKVKVG